MPRTYYLLIAILGIIASAVIAFFSLPAALAIFFSLILAFLSYKNLFWGILFLSVYTPFEPLLLKFVPDEIYVFVRYGGEALLLVLLLILLFRKMAKKIQFGEVEPPLEVRPPNILRTPIDLPLFLFLGIGIVSMILNTVGPWYVGLLGLRQLLRYAILFYLVVNAGLKRVEIVRIVKIMMVIVLLQIALGLGQAVIGEPADEFLLPGKRRDFPEIEVSATVEKFWLSGQRVFATLGRYDRLGIFLSFFLLIAAGLAYESRSSSRKKILIGLILLSLPTFFLTYSRLSWIGFLLGICFIGIIIKRSRLLFGVIFSVFLALSVYLCSYLYLTGVQYERVIDQPYMAPAERILELVSPRGFREGYRGYGRPYFLFNTPVKVIAKYPVLGVGPGQFGGGVAAALGLRDRYDELGMPFGISGTLGQIDNNWFSIWGEYGTLGFLAFLFIFINLLRFAFKAWKQSNDTFVKGLTLGFIGVLIAVIFESFFGPYFEVRTLAFYLWLFAGFVVVLGKTKAHKNL